MKALKKDLLSDKINKSYFFVLRYAVSSFAIFTLAFILLKFPAYSIDGVKKGIDICMNRLVPSLYPFMILTNIYISSKAAEMKIPLFNKLCRFLFRLPGCCAAVILFSFIGGLPIGAKMSSELCERGYISKEQCARLLCFCVNPGPAFVISAVGLSMLGSEKVGALIYASLILASLIIGFISRFFTSENETYINSDINTSASSVKGSSIETSVIKSSKSILFICSWVVAFSCLGELIVNLNFADGTKSFLLCITEMTRGSLVAAEKYPISIVSAVIGFSGICGHFQLMSAIKTAGMKYKIFLVSRIINSGLSAVICSLLLKVFPVVSETFYVGIKPESGKTSGSFILSVLMVMMAVLFVLGDDYRVIRKKV